jgi:hypothetical protein
LGGAEVGRKSRTFFFEKKNQKTFSTSPTARRILHRLGAAPLAKVFASFFKKKRLLAPPPPSAAG